MRPGHWHDWAATMRAALDATRRLGDRSNQARTQRGLALGYVRLRRLDEAHRLLHEARDLYAQLSDLAGHAHTHLYQAWVFEAEGSYQQALHQAGQALRIYREVGHRRGEALALNAVGWFHALLGQFQQALNHCREALVMFNQLEEVDGQAAC